jgi:TM2 domain-containing membrane protein YozV
MKIFKSFAFFALAFMLILSSCSIEKRVYKKGYHIEWNKSVKKSDKDKPSKEDKKAAKVESKIKNQFDLSFDGKNNPVEFKDLTVLAERVEEVKATEKRASKTIEKAVAAFEVAENNAPVSNDAPVVELEDTKNTVEAASNNAMGGKSQLVALLLAIFVGGIGIHRFYLGYTTIGIIQLLTFGGCGVWALIDLVRIIIGDLGPKNGPYDSTL